MRQYRGEAIVERRNPQLQSRPRTVGRHVRHRRVDGQRCYGERLQPPVRMQLGRQTRIASPDDLEKRCENAMSRRPSRRKALDRQHDASRHGETQQPEDLRPPRGVASPRPTTRRWQACEPRQSACRQVLVAGRPDGPRHRPRCDAAFREGEPWRASLVTDSILPPLPRPSPTPPRNCRRGRHHPPPGAGSGPLAPTPGNARRGPALRRQSGLPTRFSITP